MFSVNVHIQQQIHNAAIPGVLSAVVSLLYLFSSVHWVRCPSQLDTGFTPALI